MVYTAVDAAAVRQLVDRIRMVPDEHRDFSVDTDELARVYRIRPELQRTLLDCGLPHDGTGGARRFDALDAENIGLGLGVGPKWRIMRWWSQSLVDHDRSGRTGYWLGLSVYCPEPGHPGPCDFILDPVLVDQLHEHGLRERAPGSYTLTLPTAGGSPRCFTQPYSDLIEAAARLRFHALPRTLTSDLGFVRETGLADCELATRYVAYLGLQRGVECRRARGLFVAVPFPVWHAWPEFLTEDGWCAADPLLLSALHQWGIVDPAQWPANRSTQGMALQVSSANFRAVGHAGEQAELPLRVVNETVVAGTERARTMRG